MNRKKARKILTISIILMLIIALLAGCTVGENKVENNDNLNSQTGEIENNYPIKIVDQFDNNIIIEKKPEKIISLAPSHTEILFSLGLEDKIIGVTSFCDYPEEAKAKEKIGNFTTINLERIIELEPDMVIQYGPGDESSNARLKEAGINILSYEPETMDEVIELIRTIGKITDTVDKAEIIIKDIICRKEKIIEKVKDAEKIKVFYEIWYAPLIAAGAGSFMDELISLAGGDNIAKDIKEQYPQFDLEKLIELNPEVYLTAKDMEEKTIESIKLRPGYENIAAIKNDRIYLLEPNIVSRPGPRIIDALEIVAKSIHPELFK
jgi:iron complex transport system substrate-binding protein